MTAQRLDQARPPVIYDVARLAGVSHQTVSRVLNDHPNVSPRTRQRVELAIAQLGYRRNTAARALATRSTRTLGVVSANAEQYGPASSLLAIEQAARAADYLVAIVSLPVIDRPHMTEAIEHLMQAAVDGIIIVVPLQAATDSLRGLTIGVPLVSVDSNPWGSEGVGVDSFGGARSAVQHLLDLGHSTVAHIAGPQEWLDAQARVIGWRSALGGRGREAAAPYLGDWSAKSGYRAAQQIIPRIQAGELTAIFAANDQMALGLIHALHDADLSVPRDVSVVGFDDIPEAAHYLPPLTTVRQDFTAIGARAIEDLLLEISGRTPTARPTSVTQLVIRSSTCPPLY